MAVAQPVAASLSGAVGWPEAPWAEVNVEASASGLATWMPIADMAVGAQALVGMAAAELHRARGGPEQLVSVDRWAASLSMTTSAYLTVNGEKAVSWDPLTGYHKAADGWVYTHCQFPHLRDRMLTAFDLPNDPARVKSRFAELPASEIEGIAQGAGTCGIRMRTRQEWEAHGQFAALSEMPLIRMEHRDTGATAPRGRTKGASPLEGLRVLDLSRVIAGPMIGRTLAEHGAEVLRISAPHLPSFDSLVISTGFGKRAAFADLDTAEGRETLARLVADADVFIDGYRPGALASRGFGFDDLRALNPAIVYVTLSAFGETGPWGGRRGYDTYVQAGTGLSAEGPDGPQRLPCQPLDYLSGYLGAASTMVALRKRLERGGAWRIELALARTAMWLWEMSDALGPEPSPPAENPSMEEIFPISQEMASTFGHLRALRPATGLSVTPPCWRSAPVPLGSSAAEWEF